MNKKYYRTSSKKTLLLTNDLHETLIDLLLGDVNAEKPNKNCNTRLHIKQSIINKEYKWSI